MITVLYCLITLFVFYLLNDKLNKLEKRIQSMEDFLFRDEEWIENETDD